MVGGDVEGLEVELVALDLRAVHDDEAELAEDTGDLALGLGQGMEGAPPERPAGKRDVLGLGQEALLERRGLEARAPDGERRLDGLADRIGEGTDPGAVLGGESTDACQQAAQLALAAEHGGLDRIKGLRRRGGGDLRVSARCELVEL